MIDRNRTQREEIEELASRMPTEGSAPPRTASMHAGERGRQSQDADRTLRDQVSGTADAAMQRADAQRQKVAGSVDDAASTVRSKGSELPGGDLTTRAANVTADSMQQAAGYMQQHNVNEMAGDLERFVRDHPLESVAAAFAVGLFIGWTLNS